MDDNCVITWHSVDALILFSATIDVMLEETKQQLHYMRHLKNGIYQVEKCLITRIIGFYQSQLNKVMYYDEQLQRWLRDASQNFDGELLNDISKLKQTVEIVKQLSQSIIEHARESQVEESSNVILTTNKKMFLDFVDGKFEEKKS